MEYLVTMTTHVPEGTPGAEVEEVKSREATHSLELATEGRLLRLWRPPLEPGEWRTLGLFDAAGHAGVEAVLRSMPLRVWRTDDIVPLGPHPNDPGAKADRSRSRATSEFFTTLTTTVPPDTPVQVVEEADIREAARSRELAGEGILERLWTLPGVARTLGLWRAHDAEQMQATLRSLPLRHWLGVETTPLSAHPSDPAAMSS